MNGVGDLSFTLWKNSKFIGCGKFKYDYRVDPLLKKQLLIYSNYSDSKEAVGSLTIELKRVVAKKIETIEYFKFILKGFCFF